MKFPLVSVIILNWNGKDLTRKCLDSIKLNTSYPNYEVIVIDQDSKDGSVDMIKKNYQWVRLVSNKINVGFSQGNNIGFSKSKGEYIYILNNDTEVVKGWLENVVEVMERDKTIASAGSLQIEPKQFKTNNFSLDNEIEDVETAGGAAMIIRRSVIDKIGPFDAENFSPIYGEENDWCYRAKNASHRIVLVKNSAVVHIGEATSIKEFEKSYSFVLRETNRLKAMLFNLPARRLIKFIPGLSLIFIKSVFHGYGQLILKSYYNIWKLRKEIIKERKLRLSR